MKRKQRDRERSGTRGAEEKEDEEVKALSSKEKDEPQEMERGKTYGEVESSEKETIDLNMLHEFWIEKRETHELRLIQVHHEQLVRGRQVRLLRGELFVEVAHVLAMFLRGTDRTAVRRYDPFSIPTVLSSSELLTIFGLNGGCTSRFSIFSQSMCRKNVWTRTSSSPRRPQPSLFAGFFVRN